MSERSRFDDFPYPDKGLGTFCSRDDGLCHWPECAEHGCIEARVELIDDAKSVTGRQETK